MEKADILEMAVKHLKALRETVNSSPRHGGSYQYHNGFAQCASEVTRYIMTMDSLDDNTRSDILSHLNNTCQSMHPSVSENPTSPPLSPLVANLPHCTTHEDPCYHCYPIPYPQPHFLSQTAEHLPGHNVMSSQLFGDQITAAKHGSTLPGNRFEKSIAKSHADNSLIKMNLVQTHPFSHPLPTPCHRSLTSTRDTSLTREQANRSEPVWRPW